MSLFDPVDIYCERISAAFWAEPFNAVSNAGFVLGAYVAWRTARRLGVKTADLTLLLILAALIGVGSFLFHTFANGWSEFADTIPIWTFVATFVLAAMYRVGGVKPGRIAIIAVSVAAIVTVLLLASGSGQSGAAQVVAQDIPSRFNGSEQYLPAVIALLAFSYLGWRRQSPMAPWIWGATLVFITSLCLRTVDMHLCDIWPLGTHFAWHLLNATMIWLLLDGFIRLQAPRPA